MMVWNDLTAPLVFVGENVSGKGWVIDLGRLSQYRQEFIEQSFGESIKPGNRASTRPHFHIEAVKLEEVD